jgi:acylphosphatase
LSGFVKNLNNGDIEVVVIGTDKEAVDQFKEAIHADPERSDIWEMKEEIFHEPVKVGFEAKADYKMQVEQFKMMTEEKEKLEKELKQAQKQYRKLQESTSWKVTTPLRKFADTIKIKIRSTKR